MNKTIATMARFALFLSIMVITIVIPPSVWSGEVARADSTQQPETIVFPSADGLTISADIYIVHELTAPFIVLFHQARWSRGEYIEIAPRLNKMGFNCMAVDLRSGGAINDVENQTCKRATEQKKPTTYIDALPDMVAALKYAKTSYAQGALIVWGSSYSAALVVKLAADNPKLVDGGLSFAPGEYFAKLGQSETFITEAAMNVQCPIFITSAKSEGPNWESIYAAIPSKAKSSFLPETDGNHGSRALWSKFEDNSAYWQAVTVFLTANFLSSEPE